VVLLRGARGLAVSPFARLRWRDEARRRRPRGTTLLGRGSAWERDPLNSCLAAGSTGLAGHGACWRRPARCCSSGGSGVIWSAGLPPGSHHPRVAPGCLLRQLSPSTPLPV